MKLLFSSNKVTSDINRQINFFLLASLFSRCVFIYTIIVVFFQQYNLNFRQILLISAIEGMITFVFEIPSGIIADAWGKKRTVLAGILLGIFGLACYIIHPSFGFFIVAEVLMAAGSAFESGARTAIIYGKFEEYNIKDEYRSFVTKKARLMPIAASITVLSSSVLFSINSYLPFYLSILCMSLSFVLLYLIEDDHKAKAKKQTSSKDARILTATAVARNSFLSFFRNKQLLTLSLCSAFLITMYSNTAYLSQAYLLDLGLPLRLMGLFYFVFNLMSSLSASYSERLFKTFSMNRFLVFFFFMCVSTALLNFQLLFLVIPLYLFFCFINGVISQTINSEIPALTDEANRATVLSIVRFIQGFFALIFEPLLGLVIDHTGISTMYLVLGLSTSFIVLLALVYLYVKREIITSTSRPIATGGRGQT
ncbi:MAG: MFS transporter [Bacillota bacterium]|nr:MFS transporter [Bacillota bacterium]